jgi:lipoprotein-releasing system permease protein
LNTAIWIAQRLRKSEKKTFTALAQQVGKGSVALGLATSLVAFLIINGFEKDIYHKLTHFQGQLQVFKFSLNPTIEEPPIPTHTIHNLITTFPAIKKAIAFSHKTVLLQGKEAIEGLLCKGVDLVAQPETMYKDYITAGRFLSPDYTKYSQEIILSTTTAAKLQVQVGDTVLASVMHPQLRYRKLTVAGLYTTYIEELDEKIALCDLRLLQRLNNWPDSLVGGYDLLVGTNCDKSLLKDELLDWLGYDLDVQTIEQLNPAIFDWLVIMRKDVAVFLSLILLVATSNIICIILIQVLERARMIGLLKAMGATTGLILRVLLWNNMAVLFLGLFWGNLLGLGLASLQDIFKVIRLDPTYYYIPYVPIAWSWKTIVEINVALITLIGLLLIGAIAMIARAKPITHIALRSE